MIKPPSRKYLNGVANVPMDIGTHENAINESIRPGTSTPCRRGISSASSIHALETNKAHYCADSTEAQDTIKLRLETLNQPLDYRTYPGEILLHANQPHTRVFPVRNAVSKAYNRIDCVPIRQVLVLLPPVLVELTQQLRDFF